MKKRFIFVIYNNNFIYQNIDFEKRVSGRTRAAQKRINQREKKMNLNLSEIRGKISKWRFEKKIQKLEKRLMVLPPGRRIYHRKMLRK